MSARVGAALAKGPTQVLLFLIVLNRLLLALGKTVK